MGYVAVLSYPNSDRVPLCCRLDVVMAGKERCGHEIYSCATSTIVIMVPLCIILDQKWQCHQIKWFGYHLKRNFEGISDLKSEFEYLYILSPKRKIISVDL